MSAKFWHRLRGHTLKHFVRHVSGIDMNGEWGRTFHTVRCNCGTSWPEGWR